MGRRSFRTPAYQVDFTASASGKTFGATKRKISFKFGFANPEALNNGCVGVECRGQEHEVLCIWSVTSGKRQVFVDGQEVHSSFTNKAQAKFECNFNFMAEHVMKLTAHAAPPLASNNGFVQRQFDLSLDGQSFFDFAKLFELGMRQTAAPPRSTALVSPANGVPSVYTNYSFAEEPDTISPTESRESIRSVRAYQDFDGASAARNSAQSAHVKNLSQQRNPSPTAVAAPPQPVQEQSVDLLDLDSEVPVAPVPQTVRMPAFTAPPSVISAPSVPVYVEPSPTNYQQYSQDFMSMSYDNGSTYASQQNYSAAPMQNQRPAMAPYQKFQYQQTSYDIMNKYHEKQAQPQMSTEDCTDLVVVSPERPSGRLTMAPSNVFVEEDEDEDVDELTKTMNKICNLDYIKEDSKTKQLAKLAEKKAGCVVKDKNGKLRSKGLAPKSTHNTGASLQDIQATKASKGPSQPVMRSPPRHVFHPQAQYAGALVVYGAPQQGQGPPPLPQAFGAQRNSYGYGNYAY